MVDTWTDHVELRRDRACRFTVAANKYGENPITGRLQWGDWDKTGALQVPSQVHDALQAAATHLDIDLDWSQTVRLIAQLDWVTGAVIADASGLTMPPLPTVAVINTQRSVRNLGTVTIGVEWGYDMHEFNLPFRAWLEILNGRRLNFAQPYFYEGARFKADWRFDVRDVDHLDVGIEDGGQGWVGPLNGVDLLRGPVIDDVDLAKLALRATNTPNRASKLDA